MLFVRGRRATVPTSEQSGVAAHERPMGRRKHAWWATGIGGIVYPSPGARGGGSGAVEPVFDARRSQTR